MMLTACTPTPLKQNGRSVPDVHLLVRDCVACLDDACVSLFVFQENCSACSQIPLDLHFSPSSKLQEVLDYLTESASLYVHLIDRDDLILIILSSTGDHIYATLCCSVFSNRKNVFFVFRQMKSPAITTTVDGKNKTLYLQVINLMFSTVLYLKFILTVMWGVFWRNLAVIQVSF